MEQIYKKGYKEKIVIVAPCDYELFYKIGATIENMGASFTRRIMDYNDVYWSLIYAGQSFILNYNINSGLYLYPTLQNSPREHYELASRIAKDALETLEDTCVP